MTISIKPTASGSTIEQDGSTILTVDGSGNLTVPNNLTSTGGITGNVAFDTNTLYVDAANNRVGVGTSSPSEQLNFVGSSGTSKIRFDGDASNLQNNFIGITGYDNLVIASDEANSGTASTMQFRVDAAERMRIQSTGDVLVGTTSDIAAGSEGVEIKGNLGYIATARNTTIAASHHLFFNPNGIVGSIQTTGTTTAYVTSSDYRLKENVAPMSGSIDRLKQLKPSTWSWKIDGSHGEGFLAHEAQTVVPESATGTKDAMRTEEYEVTPEVLDDDGNVVTEAVMGTREVPDYQGIDQSKLVPLLTAALQEAITKIENLETRIEALEAN